VPVIASDLATFRAHFSDGALRFVPGGDPEALASAIVELAGDPDAAMALASEAQREAQPYAWSAQSERYLAVIGRLLGGDQPDS
jgi:glycosyltransferase involved in cell wall biosynthesis